VKLKFTNINTTTSRVSVRNKETSLRERAQNKSQANEECDTWICFTEVRFLQTYSPLRRPQSPLEIPEAGEFLRLLLLGAPDTVRCARPEVPSVGPLLSC
jgi:hypothetical protein